MQQYISISPYWCKAYLPCCLHAAGNVSSYFAGTLPIPSLIEHRTLLGQRLSMFTWNLQVRMAQVWWPWTVIPAAKLHRGIKHILYCAHQYNPADVNVRKIKKMNYYISLLQHFPTQFVLIGRSFFTTNLLHRHTSNWRGGSKHILYCTRKYYPASVNACEEN